MKGLSINQAGIYYIPTLCSKTSAPQSTLLCWWL